MKKAQGWTELAMGIVALALIATIGMWVYDFGESGKQERDVQACAYSVRSAATYKIAGQSLTKINCPRNHIRFEDESQLEINAKLAKDLNNAVYITGEGEYDWTDSPWTTLYLERALCIILNTYSFDEKYTNTYKSGSFMDYLNRNRPRRSSQSYMEYFRQVENKPVGYKKKLHVLVMNETGSLAKISSNPDETIYPAFDYTLFFVRMPLTLAENYFGVLYLGEVPPLSYVVLAPTSSTKSCEVVMN